MYILKSISIFLLLFCTLLDASSHDKDLAHLSIIDHIQEQLIEIDGLLEESVGSQQKQCLEFPDEISSWWEIASAGDVTGSYQKAHESYFTAQSHLSSNDLVLAHNELQQSLLVLDNLCISKQQIGYNDFEENPYTSLKQKQSIAPYLLPLNHPARPCLDAIFLNQRAILNAETFAAAGFISRFIQPRSFIRVASHPYLTGYLVKVYLDSELRNKKNIPGWQWFVNRTKNAKRIEKFIKRKNFTYFTVAKKWIYPLPINPDVPMDPAYVRKNEILLVEDMNLVSKIDNRKAWKSVITKKHLHEFFEIINYAGGHSYRASNVAFTESGKFAFIDTEYTSKKTDYYSILPYLSPEMAAYWKEITGLVKDIDNI